MKVASLAIDLRDLRPPHRMSTMGDCFQTDAINPAMHQPGILSGGYVRACMKSAREEISSASRSERSPLFEQCDPRTT
jgi:hypothetical protein